MAVWQSGFMRSPAERKTSVRFGVRPPRKKGGKMPVRKIGNKWQYGTTGKKYTSRAKAVAQGRAIKISQLKRGKKVK